MKKVIILQPVMAHYRRSFFENILSNKEYSFEFVAGNKYQDIKSIDSIKFKGLNHLSFRLLSHNFYYLKGCLKFIISRKPDIIISGGVDFHLIHTIFAFIYFRLILRKKFIWWSHATTDKHSAGGKWLRKFFYSKSNGILTYNNKGKADLISLGINENKIEVLGNSINTEDYGFLNYNLEETRENSELFTILFTGRINEGRRLDLLLNALKTISLRNEINYECYIIGQGPIDNLLDLTKELKLTDKVHFLGAKYGKEVSEYFIKADLVVYPQAIGLALLQAHSYGLPVITTNDLESQMPEIELLSPNITGDFYIDKDYLDLANKISEWQIKISTSRNEISDACIQGIKDFDYLPESMCKTLVRFIGSRLN